MNVLIADDDRVTTVMIAGRLKALGYQTQVAHDAMQVGMMAQRTPPDAILLDVNMPGGSGIHALQRLKASSKTSHIPVIVLTASTDHELPKKVLGMGADAFLAKPVDFEKLQELLKRFADAGADKTGGSPPKP